MRAAFLFLHRWLGLAAGLVLAFIGLTGSALVFRAELDGKIEPRLLRVEPQEGKVSWQSIYDAARRARPDAKINHLFLGKTPHTSHEFWLNGGEEYLYVHPYSGDVLGERTNTGGVLPWLYQAHTHLLSGETGEKVAGWCGLVLASLSLSGLYLWLPRKLLKPALWKNAFRLHWRTNWKGRIYELHRWGGFWVAGFLLVSSLSGVALIWTEQVTQVVAAIVGQPVAAKKKGKATKSTLLPLDELVKRADEAFPVGTMTRISFPAKPDAPLLVRKRLPGELHPNGVSTIALDGATGRVLWINDAREANLTERIMNWRYPLHIGVWGGAHWGTASRMLQVLIGLAPVTLLVSGFLMWRHRRKPRSGKEKVSRTETSAVVSSGEGELQSASVLR